MSNYSIKIDAPIIPSWLVVTQAVCFAILYAVWMLPKTTFLRNSCLGLGAFLSLFVIFKFRKAFLTKAAIPVYLLSALYVWLLFHLLFLSNDFQAQYLELTSVWKNSAIGIVFGLGFGISLMSMTVQASEANLKGSKDSRLPNAVWVLIWIGLMTPEVIYLIKWLLMRYGVMMGFNVPDYLKLWSSSAPYYISKNTYVCFCLPVFSIALGQFILQIERGQLFSIYSPLYLLAIVSTLFVFWCEHIFNGFIYAFICLIIGIAYLLFGSSITWAMPKKITSLIFLVLLMIGIAYQAFNDSHFQYFAADAKVAMQGEVYSQWKYDGMQGYPKNEFGFQVNPSSYERVSWFYQGVQLIPRHPWGYGLLQSSFGRLIKQDYPDSKLHQSHSGWLDLILGVGVIGFGLIMVSLLWLLYGWLIFKKSYIRADKYFQQKNLKKWMLVSLVNWMLIALGLIWITTELSQKIYVDHLLYWLAISSGMWIGNHENLNFAKNNKLKDESKFSD